MAYQVNSNKYYDNGVLTNPHRHHKAKQLRRDIINMTDFEADRNYCEFTKYRGKPINAPRMTDKQKQEEGFISN